MRKRSMRRRLVAVLLVAMAAAWLAIGAATYVDSHREIDALLDAHLAQSARLVIAQAGHELDDIEIEDLDDVPGYRQRVAFQVWEDGRKLVLRSAAGPSARLSPVDSGFSDAVLDGRRWRVFSGWDREHEVLVQVGEDHAAREAIARRIARNSLLPLLFALPLLGGLVWWLVGRGLWPLRDLGREVELRGPQDLRPLGLRDPPAEIAPVAATLDRLFERMRDSLDSERRFTSHAAHEMRTPMAAIRAQAEVARDTRDPQARDAALHRVIEACDRAARLVEQLLMLARVDEAGTGASHVWCRLDDITRRVLAEQVPWALGRGVALELEAVEAPVRGDPVLLEVLVRNLVDNAVRHGGPGSVRVFVVSTARGARLDVEDSGPGVADGEVQRLGQRFYRAASARGSGSGLGLSIVGRIVELHGAVLRFGRNKDGAGMRIEVDFDADAGSTTVAPATVTRRPSSRG